jgi:hypothetical protein
MFTVLITADVLNPDTEETFNGYVSPKWSMYELRSEPTDVESVTFDTKAEAEAYVESTIGVADSYDGEYWYAADSKMNLESGESWTYQAVIREEL